MSGHRKAAVALHGLHEDDRALLLAELPEADGRQLRAYLDELDALGFDPDVSGQSRAASPTAPPGDALEQATASTMHGVLQGEPASLVAQVLSLRAWPWRGDYLGLQTATRREQLRAAAPLGAVAPARARFLLAALHARLAALPAAVSASATPAPWSAWAKTLRMRWKR